MGQVIQSHQFANGLQLVCETMDWVESAAFSLSLPAGCAWDPEDRGGLANLTCEMAQRGCGELDSRGFVETLDRLGADRGAAVTQAHTSFFGSMLRENLEPVLSIFADLVQRPVLPETQLPDAQAVCVHEVQSLDDDLAQRTMNRLRQLTYPAPWGRAAVGQRDHIEQISMEDVQGHIQRTYVPQGTILAVAGNVQFDAVRDAVGKHFGEWQGAAPDPIIDQPASGKYVHVPCDSSQTQIGVAYESVPYSHADYFQSRGAVGVLSDGMSSRLFTEVRENRGLCYTVYASCHSLRHEGRVLCYAGTSTERAQETLDVMVAEIKRLADGIDETELKRLRARTKSALIMQQESSSARANALSGDWYHLGRVRTMEELNQLLDDLSCDSVNDYLKRNPPQDFAVVTLGERALEPIS